VLSVRHKGEDDSHRDGIGWSKDSTPTPDLTRTNGSRTKESDDGEPKKAELRACAAQDATRAHRARTCGNSKLSREEPLSRTLSILNAALRVWEAKHSYRQVRSVWKRRSQA
jgi:hypothetical protein